MNVDLERELPAQIFRDEEAIKEAVLDFIEGWYQGDEARRERAIHPKLAKRIVRIDPPTGTDRLDEMSALGLLQATRGTRGPETPKEMQIAEISILDMYESIASVKLVASYWIDYLHLAKFNGEWLIVNVLWEMKPEFK